MKTTYQPILLTGLALASLTAGTFFWRQSAQPTPPQVMHTATEAMENKPATKRVRLASLMQGQLNPSYQAGQSTRATTSEASEFTSFGFSLSRIYQAIGEIEIEGDALVIDNNAKYLLEQSVVQLGLDLSDDNLKELTALLVGTLPEPFGAQAGSLLRNFYDYKRAEKQYLSAAPKADELQVEPLAQLRRQHLGGELANQLYGNEEALVRFYAKAQQIHQQPDTNQQQMAQQTDRLKEDLAAGYLHLGAPDNPGIAYIKNQAYTLREQGASDSFINHLHDQNITFFAAQKAITNANKKRDFQQRLARFNKDKRAILKAGLVEQDKLEQIDQIAQTYFSARELDLARHYKAQPNPNL
ncbi:lipase secretion chaperone [Halioxenophilus aromaticivorans]|uniref:Lipase chaperone n=1 Tax=Halioxenophilus aromaticivorans TaxID=1306992 RepID=A0AAV3UAC9_9ALTE